MCVYAGAEQIYEPVANNFFKVADFHRTNLHAINDFHFKQNTLNSQLVFHETYCSITNLIIVHTIPMNEREKHFVEKSEGREDSHAILNDMCDTHCSN